MHTHTHSPGVQEGGARRAASKYNSDVGLTTVVVVEFDFLDSGEVSISKVPSKRPLRKNIGFELSENDRRNIML